MKQQQECVVQQNWSTKPARPNQRKHHLKYLLGKKYKLIPPTNIVRSSSVIDLVQNTHISVPFQDQAKEGKGLKRAADQQQSEPDAPPPLSL
jgi:predicted house-cleaning NTP pyrophosphatase (Maf/HAM1 superfamily)